MKKEIKVNYRGDSKLIYTLFYKNHSYGMSVESYLFDKPEVVSADNISGDLSKMQELFEMISNALVTPTGFLDIIEDFILENSFEEAI